MPNVPVQEDWQMRRQAVETFITLAAAVQVSPAGFPPCSISSQQADKGHANP